MDANTSGDLGLMEKQDIEFFTAYGFSWEYPGFLDRRVLDYSFTVGHSDPEKPEVYTVQIISDDGECVAGRDCETREEVLNYFEEVCRGGIGE